MLSGDAVVAIWNGVADGWRAQFHAWHNTEHMPERLAIPGFRSGRRFVAAGPGTSPEWFTLYEVASAAVLDSPAYLARLNAPTPWTRAVTAQFQTTSRALARVAASAGPGTGGVLLTLRFDAGPDAESDLVALVVGAVQAARVTGAHVCVNDAAAASVVTAESRARTDLVPPPAWFALVEACDEAALDGVLPDAALHRCGARGAVQRGVYRLEYGIATPAGS